MLLIMLDSLDRTLRDVCTRLLTDLAADDRVRCAPPAFGWLPVLRVCVCGWVARVPAPACFLVVGKFVCLSVHPPAGRCSAARAAGA